MSGPADVVQEEQIRRDCGQCGGRDEAGAGGRGQREEHPEVEALGQPRPAGGCEEDGPGGGAGV